MTDFNFSIIIVFIMFSMIAILLLSIKLELTVKAGKVTKYCGKYAFVAYRKPDKVILGNHVVILKHDLIINNIEGFRRIVQSKIDEYKKDKYHSRNPAALKHLKARMESSINIYNRYISR